MKPRVKKLANGLRIIKIPSYDTKAVSVLVLIKTGSRYENLNNNGVSHFIEHLLFKGTTKRANTQILSQELDKIGAEYNAFTAKDYTGFYIKAQSKKIELALDILSDIIFNSKFNRSDIDRERGVIIEEINMYEDTPMVYCGEMLEELMFGANHALGRFIAGPKKVILNIHRQDILKYKDQYYLPNNMLIAVSGKIEKDIHEKIKKYFLNSIKKKKIPNFNKFADKQKKKRILIKYKKTEQVHLALGFPGLAMNNINLPAFNLLGVILGGNMSSRLFINIREKLGLCYYIKASADSYEDTGIFSIQSGLDKTRINEAIKAILNELKQIIINGVKPEELTKAKDYLAGRVALDLEESLAVASWYAKQSLFLNRLETPDEKIKKYNKVSISEINKIAKTIFKQNKMNLAIIGPFNNKNKFNKILNY